MKTDEQIDKLPAFLALLERLRLENEAREAQERKEREDKKLERLQPWWIQSAQ